jgi:hypothetical protein
VSIPIEDKDQISVEVEWEPLGYRVKIDQHDVVLADPQSRIRSRLDDRLAREQSLGG